MKLHHHPLSPYSRKALVAVLHRSDPVELLQVDVFGGGLRKPSYLKLNPFGKMPVLETPQGPLFESTSIIEYLEERGSRVLLPLGDERVARHYDRLGDLYLIDPQTELFFRPQTEAGKAAPDIAAKAWTLFEHRLRDRPFVCGNELTLGDLGAAIGTDYLQRLGVEPPAAIRAWRDRCFQVPAMARVADMAEPFLRAMLERRPKV